ncbi:putative disease resistance protein RGA1 [Amaranthus tricolor]|uniref:putative disease resistance protein RGA1 n=1 Tax=Amaranthus tricolor TaxID=29722 RepID=UPI002585581F|nr:putative disease resistance protein RGA1 [Amaranthus tricolor]XP_057528340.1 putative disease resistance protein RGA1 [Amaranthus tricolor]XP_057528341.1 putative disease resistance protein RGA1 [Amaranthus tricolor]XP_057528342.1 putative disease resistance protein RGA1 [Amaranthus tricolor]XP_057528343.1 putative disease resistance protein RGA1 [Amaranthus tricolor]XP_057528344.1 putative disease resistance protein RGA1 [Amaranthus tricolor]XP_057528345.1 putative disease resistance prot
MADVLVSVAGKLIEGIGSAVIQEILRRWGYKSELESLEETISSIRRVLLDAESKRELTNEEQGYIGKLKDAVYDADDLFDEFLTLAELKKVRPDTKHGKFFGTVSSFFSSKNQVGVAYRMSRQVKEIRKTLDCIVANNRYGFSVDYKPIIRRREETCSYVDAKEIIGRENDKMAVIDMLLDPKVDDVQFLTIVGVGGLGKTALAQLVFIDGMVEKAFPDLRLWVCVSDQDGKSLDVKTVLWKILALVTSRKNNIACGSDELEKVQNEFQKYFRGRKYLLVLDDLWNEHLNKWLELRRFLLLGGVGSRVIVTTRSKNTAKIIGDTCIYNLGGLSPESSWQLFKVAAFKGGLEQVDKLVGTDKKIDDELVRIGEKIVERCCSNPLAIKVVGSLLYGQGIHKWRSFEESGLAGIGNGDNDIMFILKLSYHNLASSLKNCFTYCSLFPKDFPFNKDMVISGWMAQGYIVPFDRGQSREDAAKEYFSILLRRCFFQDTVKNKFGEIEWFKMHDLMHDVAQEVSREEICMVSSMTNLGDRIRHVYYFGDKYIESCSNSKIRSFIDMHHNKPVMIKEIDSYKCLRRLDLRNSQFGDMSLLHSIGKLLHLRYLDLSNKKELKVLPNSITELHNLETLILINCINLRQLPEHFSKLVQLRHLDLRWCGLSVMPSGMNKLTSLRVLPIFVVGYGELKDLLAFTNIEGKIHIKINANYSGVEGMNDREEGYLKTMKHLTAVEITFDRRCVDSEVVMKKLEPHSNVKGFSLKGYFGKKIPRWGTEDNNWAITLSHLVDIQLDNCPELEQMPLLSKLPHLKSLTLSNLRKLEYMEDANSGGTNAEAAESMTFFPNLESLELSLFIRLKGWWRGEGLVDADDVLRRKYRFPRLSKLKITCCCNLTSFPSCPSLEELTLSGNHKNLQILKNLKDKEEDEVKLKIVDILDNNVGCLKSIRSPCLTALAVSFKDVGITSEVGEVFQNHASSLQKLTIYDWFFTKRHSSLAGLGLEHLTSLELLEFIFEEPSYYGVERKYNDDDDDDGEGMIWKSLNQSLHTLRFDDHEDIRRLPRGIQYLTSLQTLQLWRCHNLQALPDWMNCLSSLRSLSIYQCISLKSLPGSIQSLILLQRLEIRECTAELGEKCKEPYGEDWPKIQHIPHIEIRPLPRDFSSKQLMICGSRVETWPETSRHMRDSWLVTEYGGSLLRC